MKQKATLGAIILGLSTLIGCPANNTEHTIQPGTVELKETIQLPAECKQVINAGLTEGRYRPTIEYIVGTDSKGNIQMWYHEISRNGANGLPGGQGQNNWIVREYVQAKDGISGIYSATNVEQGGK